MNAPPVLENPQPVRLTVVDFELLEHAGAFRAYHKVELVRGEIVAMNAQMTRHSWAKNELGFRLRESLAAIDSVLSVQIEATVELSSDTMVDPDILVTSKPRGDRYITQDVVHLIVEVADTTVNYDLKTKSRLYAEMGIREYWVVDLPAATLRQFADPSGGNWDSKSQIALGDTATSLTIPSLKVSTHELI